MLLLLLLLLSRRYARFRGSILALRLIQALDCGCCDSTHVSESAHLDHGAEPGSGRRRRTMDGFGVGAVVAVAFSRAGVEV